LEEERTTVNQIPEQGGGLKIPILFGVVLALLGANVYLFMQVADIKAEMAKSRETILSEITDVKETHTLTTQASQSNINNLKQQLAAARAAAAKEAGQAKDDALAHADAISAKLEAEQKKAQEQTQAAISQVDTKVSAVSSDVGNVRQDVGSVKQEVAANKSELDKTISNLKQVTGDLGVQSGFIATNTKELDALKALGDRTYIEFKIGKTKQPYKVADITVLLKNADPKRNRYTIELVADDKKFEKKDRSVLEPVQFYMSKYRQPYEIVVNNINKDQIVGYLAQPKVQNNR
jgi:chromosome segregation ATPase